MPDAVSARTLQEPPFEVEAQLLTLTRALRRAGGRALIVGGFVRDRLLGRSTKDYDLEVYGLPLARLEGVLSGFGEVIAIGRAFGVLRIKGLDADFSIPRRDSKTGRGHRGFVVELDPQLDFRRASRRRDLTINSMGYDPLSHEILDPWGGRDDLRQGVLRATDRDAFGEDSLRALRVAQFLARFEMQPDAELTELCAAQDLADLPGERLFEELKKLLLKARRPSLGLEFLRTTGLLRFFPELAAMVDVPQDSEWHPEGTVWQHTMLVVDEAAALRHDTSESAHNDLVLMLGALCHDIGKPDTTVHSDDGRIRSPEHEDVGVPITHKLMARLRTSKEMSEQVSALVRHHLAPAVFPMGGAKPRAYRRLARRLDAAGVQPELLYRVAQADHFGRTTPDALAREFPAGEEFWRQMQLLAQETHTTKDVVLGRHLIERGFQPGPHFGPMLAACREVQDETGWDDPERIMDDALGPDGTPKRF